MTNNILNGQLANLTARVDHLATVPMYQKAAHVQEMLAIQLSLLDEMVDRIEALETAIKAKADRKSDL